MPRLPTPGSDNGIWGDILNDFLKVELDASTGQLKIRSDGTLSAKYEKPAGGIPESDLDSAVQTKLNSGSGSGYTPGGTDVAVADGGTGASTAANARTNLGLAIGSDVQAYDPDLDAIAGVVSNGLIARTGNGNAASRSIAASSSKISITDGNGVLGNPTIDLGTVSIDDLSDVALASPGNGNLLKYNGSAWVNDTATYYSAGGTDIPVADGGTGASTAANARTNLGLAIGADVQAYDADLTAVAGLSTTGLINRTGAGTATTVSAPTGTIVGTTDAQTLTNKRITKRVGALTDGATITPDADSYDEFTVTLGGNRTMAAPSGVPTAGQKIIFVIKQDGTGSRTLTWDSIYRFSAATPPLLTTTASKTDYIGFRYNAVDSKWDCIAERLNF